MTSTKKNKIKKIAEQFRDSLKFPKVSSKSGAELLFDSDLFTALFRERFGVSSEYAEAFNAAFKAVTEGVGKEITKINSVVSSALLPLLVFYKLYTPKDGQSITLEVGGKTMNFTRAFFEVRNKVIGHPSCVDVALVSGDRKTILFLESKLTEMFEDTRTENEYGSSYKDLYKQSGIMDALNSRGITIDKEATNLILRSELPQYLEGIKQSISHLIGLVKGPQDNQDQSEYIKAYNDDAKVLIYATIFYDSTHILHNQAIEYENYHSLYSDVIGAHGDAILVDIKKWAGKSNGKTIVIEHNPLTYQKLAQENPDWLDDKVKTFYGL